MSCDRMFECLAISPWAVPSIAPDNARVSASKRTPNTTRSVILPNLIGYLERFVPRNSS